MILADKLNTDSGKIAACFSGPLVACILSYIFGIRLSPPITWLRIDRFAREGLSDNRRGQSVDTSDQPLAILLVTHHVLEVAQGRWKVFMSDMSIRPSVPSGVRITLARCAERK